MPATLRTTVLTIEDDAVVRRSLRAYLEDSGFGVLEAANGQAGLDVFRREQPDLVLTDLRMPGKDGLDVIDALRAERPETPVIVVSGTGKLENALDAVRRGAWDYVIKPIADMDALQLTVNRALERARLLRENRLHQEHLEQLVQERTAELQDAHDKLSATLQAIPDLLFEADETGRIHDYHAPTHELPDFVPALCIGKTFSEVMPEPAARVILEALTEAARQGWHRGASYALNLPGGKRWFELSIAAKGPNHVPEPCFIVTIRDITERKHAEELIQAQYQQLQAQHQELVAQEKMLREAEAALRQVNAGLEQRVADRTSELSLANSALAGAVRAKDDFLARMSHELRTPLTAILGLAESLRMGIYGPVTEQQFPPLQNITHSGEHLLALINDVLDLSKVEAGKMKLHIGPVVVDEVCQASLRIVQEMAQRKNLRVVYSPDGVVGALSGDARRVKQMLVNLLNNAVKFTPEGGAVGLSVQSDADRQVVRFTVWDTGIGIAREHLARLFEPFVQIDSGLSRQNAGTGLGLSLVARMAELHGGSVAVESEGVPGKGSRFTIVLPWGQWSEPAALAPLPVTDPDGRRALAAEGAPKGARSLSRDWAERDSMQAIQISGSPVILVTDDNELTCLTLKAFFEAHGCRVAIARNGAEALERAHETCPALILMDIQMPEVDGLEAIRRLRADHDRQLAGVPIIALTALAMPGDRERCLEAGANDYLSKPLNMRALGQAVQALLEEARKKPPAAS